MGDHDSYSDSAALVLHHGDAAARRAGTVYVILAMVGEVMLFAGFVFLAAASGTTEIVRLRAEAGPPAALLLLLLGFGVKAGALSVHFWLPLAHPAAPLPASAVLSGAMIKAGLLGWLRFLPLGDAALPGIGFTMIALGLSGALLSTFAGVLQANAKTVLAYSSIAQMGIITAGVGIGLVRPDAWPALLTAVLIYATHHALAKGALFLAIGPARQAKGLLQRTVVGVGLVVPALALAGAPFTSGALAKVALKGNLAFLPAAWADALAILLPIAAVGTTLKMVRFLWLAWPGRTPLAPARAGLWTPWLFLEGAVLAGVWLLPGAAVAVKAAITPGAIWAATWPLVVGAALAALAHRLQHSLGGAATVPPGDVVVPLERAARALTRTAARVAAGVERLRPDVASLHVFGDRVAATALRGEQALCRWPVAGVQLLLVFGCLLLGSWLGGEPAGPAPGADGGVGMGPAPQQVR